MKIIAFVFLALIVSCYGKPQEKPTPEQLEKHMRDMIEKNVQIHHKWSGFKDILPGDGSKNNPKAAREQLDELCKEYSLNPNSPSVTSEISQLCGLLSRLN